MRRRGLLNLGLAGLLLVLAGLLGWLQQTPSDRLSRLDPTQVRRLAIERGGESIVLERDGDQWWLRAPAEGAARSEPVERVLRLLESRYSARYAPNEVDLQAAGLLPPRVSLRVDAHHFELGALEALGTRRYLRYGDTVYLIEDRVSAALLAPWQSFLVAPDAALKAL